MGKMPFFFTGKTEESWYGRLGWRRRRGIRCWRESGCELVGGDKIRNEWTGGCGVVDTSSFPANVRDTRHAEDAGDRETRSPG